MYKVVTGFIDIVESKGYKAGDEFVVGPKTDDKRLALLSSANNNLGKTLIVMIDEPAEEVADQPPVKRSHKKKGAE